MQARDPSAPSLAELARAGAATLSAAGLSNSYRDAELLLRHALGVDLETWLTHQLDSAPQQIRDRFHSLISRRAQREPIAYITGSREFYGRPFTVTPAVLIPRPETELIVDAALRAIARHNPTGGGALRVADVGTGSGCLAITLALEAPGLEIVATDVADDALDVARSNARALGAMGIRFRKTSLLEGEPGPFDVIVSNPPYVRVDQRAALMPDVRDYEPAMALFGGDDGLGLIRAVIGVAGDRLTADGQLVMEIGNGQADDVAALVEETGLTVTAVICDLAGLERVVVAGRPAASLGSV